MRPRIAHDRIVCGTSGSSGVLVPAHVAVVNRNASALSSTCRSPEGDALWLHTLRRSLDVSGCEPSDKVEVRGCNTQSCCLAQVFRGRSILHSRSCAGNGNGCTDGLWGQWGSWSGAQLLRLCTPSSGPHALRPAMVAPPTASVPGRSRESSSFFMKRASEHTKDTLCRTRVIADAQPLATRMRLESATLSQLLKGREAF